MSFLVAASTSGIAGQVQHAALDPFAVFLVAGASLMIAGFVALIVTDTPDSEESEER